MWYTLLNTVKRVCQCQLFGKNCAEILLIKQIPSLLVIVVVVV